ncbi:MAG: hypothetical protein QCI38_03060, partial [Candidatus Thermoplasmatota archaeon]|nr:hypothetical protein [Candidatus Thermoplasmatota archaeon]
ILQIVVPIFLAFNAIGSVQQASMQQMWSDIRNSAVIQAAIGMMFSLFLALMFYMMIAGIALPGDKSKAKLGVVMFLLSGIMSIVVVLLVLPENMANVNMTAADLQNLTSASYMGYAVQIVGYVLFFLAYMGVKKGMDGGAIKPGGAMPPQNMYGGI